MDKKELEFLSKLLFEIRFDRLPRCIRRALEYYTYNADFDKIKRFECSKCLEMGYSKCKYPISHFILRDLFLRRLLNTTHS